MNMLPTEVHLQGLDAWRQMARDHFVSLECSTAQPASFRSSALVARFSDSLAAEMAVTASRVLRRRRDAENEDSAHFKILWQLVGRSHVAQGAHSAVLEPGMWSVYDTTREYAIESSDRSRFMVLLVPRSESHGWSPAVEALAGRALEGGGAPRIVMSALAGMLRDGTPLDAESQRTLQDSTVALLERALDAEVRSRGLSLNSDLATRLARVQSWIQEHLADPHLTPEKAAQTFGMSRRSLYNLFLASGSTPRAFIQQARLDRACTLLAQPLWREAPLAQVAQQCGFADPGHFSRAFHARHGMPPSRWREQRPQ